MKNLFVKGACPRRLLNYVLPSALLGSGFASAELEPDDIIHVTTTYGVTELGLEMAEKDVVLSQSPALVAIFEDFDKSTCHGMILMRPTALSPRCGGPEQG